MASDPDYSMHLAVWNDDIERLQVLLLQQKEGALEQRDHRDNTPYLLALRMGRTKLARMLLAAGSYAKARTNGGTGWEAIQVAALTGNPDLVRTAVVAFLAQTDKGFESRMPDLHTRLEGLPDFQCTMSWSFESWIPLLGNLLPSDNYLIFKRGSSLRLDTTLLGMTGLRWERGSVSLLLWGKDMPRPGTMFVIDNDMCTAADARMAFTHPQDVHIQDWVRKLLTQKQKISDFWTRDCQTVPVMQKSLLEGLFSKAGKMLGMDSSPRGRLTDFRSTEDSSSSTASTASSTDADDAMYMSRAAPPMTAQAKHRVLTEDIGVWPRCSVYEMKNICIRDVTAPPILSELKLDSWWKQEYSRQATEADVAAAQLAGTAYAQQGSIESSAVPGAEVSTSEAPETLLRPLKQMLRAIQAGKINEGNASSATLEDVEGLANGIGEESSRYGGAETSHVRVWTFEEYWGTKASHSSGHKPSGSLCELREDRVTTDDKSLDAKVYFSKDFPITVNEFLPVAEMMARTSSHAANLRRFFASKMPPGEGFPVKFSLPIMFGITATVSFDYCDASRPIAKSVFEIPPNFKMGAYIERGFIRQL